MGTIIINSYTEPNYYINIVSTITSATMRRSPRALYITFAATVSLAISGTLVANPVENGDAYFARMKYEQAIATYKLDSLNSEAQWRIARAYICIADLQTIEQKKPFIDQAEKAARLCIRLNERNNNGHTFLAAALGNRAMFEGSRTKVKLCTEIKKELLRAIALNPKDDVAYSILGTFNRVVGNISWFEKELAEVFLGGIPSGGYSDGEKVLKKAIELSPTTIRHWYELGLLYKDWGKKEEARKVLTQALLLKVQIQSDNRRKNHSKELLLSLNEE